MLPRPGREVEAAAAMYCGAPASSMMPFVWPPEAPPQVLAGALLGVVEGGDRAGRRVAAGGHVVEDAVRADRRAEAGAAVAVLVLGAAGVPYSVAAS